MKKLSCNLNELLHMRDNLLNWKPTWNEIIMIIIFLVVMSNGVWNLYIR